MNALRIPVAAISGLVLALALFWLMQALISGGRPALARGEPEVRFDFVRLKKETQTQARQRVLPEKPTPPKPLPRPRLSIPHKVPAVTAPRLDIPLDFDLPLTLSGGPDLGSLAVPEPDSAFMPVSRPPPRYPYQAKRRGIEGWVRVSFTVTGNGSVEDVVVEEAEPPGVFERAARTAVSGWKFQPRVVDGKPTAGRAEQLVEFRLHE
jgi:protein TonB